VNVDQDLVGGRDRLRRLARAQRANSLESIAKNGAHWPPMTGVSGSYQIHRKHAN
jgi:hypothetical protein